jgi:entericidin B
MDQRKDVTMKLLTKIGLVIVLPLAISIAISACNTVQGFGKDVEHGGQHIQNAANNNK